LGRRFGWRGPRGVPFGPMEGRRATVERVEAALASLWSRQCGWMPGGKSEQVGSATLVMTDCESASLRGPVLYLADSDDSLVDRALELAAALQRGLAIDLMAGLRGGVVEYLSGRGFERIASRQLMVVDPMSIPDRSSASICARGQLEAVHSIQELSFGMSAGDVTALYPLAILDVEDTELVVVSDSDSVVAAATVHHDLGITGIFGVACDPNRRGHGFGTAASIGAVDRAKVRGDDLCWLQATDDVAPFYERLGFRTIDSCDVWVTAYA